ncbi:hypothetical protein ONZ45_g7364 [Pleurotus djamor]|nr:hypothetical protein ONZ45_g7364 [Pleurotus djamor]
MFASQREEIEFQEEKKVSKERARTYKNQVSKAAKEAALLSKLVESKRKHIKRLKKLAKAIKHARHEEPEAITWDPEETNNEEQVLSHLSTLSASALKPINLKPAPFPSLEPSAEQLEQPDPSSVEPLNTDAEQDALVSKAKSLAGSDSESTSSSKSSTISTSDSESESESDSESESQSGSDKGEEEEEREHRGAKAAHPSVEQVRHKRDSKLVVEEGDDGLVSCSRKKSHHRSHGRRKAGPKKTLGDFNKGCQHIVKNARLLLKKQIILENALPENQDIKDKKLFKRLEKQDPDCIDEMVEYVGYAISFMRNMIKTRAATITCSSYALLGQATSEEIKKKVAWLLQGNKFHFGGADAQTKSLRSQELYMHPCIADVLRITFFENTRSSKVVNAIFMEMVERRTIPLPLFALVLTAIQHCLEEYQTGHRVPKEFRGREIIIAYRHHMRALTLTQNQAGGWLKGMLDTTWTNIMRQTRPSFLDNIDNSQDIMQDFAGVDFEALRQSAQTAPTNTETVVESALSQSSPASPQPHENEVEG